MITIPEKMSVEKKALLRAYGAKVIITPNLPHSDPNSYYEVAKRLTKGNSKRSLSRSDKQPGKL